MRNQWESLEIVMIKWWESHEKDSESHTKWIRAMNYAWESHKKVIGKSWESHERVMIKSWESHEKFIIKSWKSHMKAIIKTL